MRTTVTLDDELVDKAAALTGIKERSALVREAMNTLVRVESARRLAALGGTDARAGRRRVTGAGSRDPRRHQCLVGRGCPPAGVGLGGGRLPGVDAR